MPEWGWFYSRTRACEKTGIEDTGQNFAASFPRGRESVFTGRTRPWMGPRLRGDDAPASNFALTPIFSHARRRKSISADKRSQPLGPAQPISYKASKSNKGGAEDHHYYHWDEVYDTGKLVHSSENNSEHNSQCHRVDYHQPSRQVQKPAYSNHYPFHFAPFRCHARRYRPPAAAFASAARGRHAGLRAGAKTAPVRSAIAPRALACCLPCVLSEKPLTPSGSSPKACFFRTHSTAGPLAPPNWRAGRRAAVSRHGRRRRSARLSALQTFFVRRGFFRGWQFSMEQIDCGPELVILVLLTWEHRRCFRGLRGRRRSLGVPAIQPQPRAAQRRAAI